MAENKTDKQQTTNTATQEQTAVAQEAEKKAEKKFSDEEIKAYKQYLKDRESKDVSEMQNMIKSFTGSYGTQMTKSAYVNLATGMFGTDNAFGAILSMINATGVPTQLIDDYFTGDLEKVAREELAKESQSNSRNSGNANANVSEPRVPAQHANEHAGVNASLAQASEPVIPQENDGNNAALAGQGRGGR